MAGRVIKIGNAGAFWGDRIDAAAELLRQQPDLDFITIDYLAEVSMSILAKQRERNPSLGYAADFVETMRLLAPLWLRQRQAGSRLRVITNAGGLNPTGCARACSEVFVREASTHEPLACASGSIPHIAVVTGDDVLETIRSRVVGRQPTELFRNLETGEPIETVLDRLVTANAYLGAGPLVQALSAGADIVITGRVADPSLTVAACLAHFDWTELDSDRVASATVAGHLIECGTQVTGGISTDWLAVPDPAHIGFPVIEIEDNGAFVVSKPVGTGGRVDELTVKEQLLYEIGDPGQYLSPDAKVSFLSLNVEEIGPDRVRVSGATGGPPPPTYKVSATYREGYRASGMLTICGAQAGSKARRCAEIVRQRLRERGCEPRGWLAECLGAGDGVPIGRHAAEAPEVVLRITASDPRREVLEQFSRELVPLVTAGPQGTTGYFDGRPKVREVFGYWPCLIERSAVAPKWEML